MKSIAVSMEAKRIVRKALSQPQSPISSSVQLFTHPLTIENIELFAHALDAQNIIFGTAEVNGQVVALPQPVIRALADVHKPAVRPVVRRVVQQGLGLGRPSSRR